MYLSVLDTFSWLSFLVLYIICLLFALLFTILSHIYDMKLKYLQRAGQSVNYLVRGLFVLTVDKSCM